MPQISVIIPTYKRPEYLKEAVNSVLRQTFNDFELIIINDGGNDDTKSIINEMNDSRIVFIEHKQNMGVSESRNKGIYLAKSKYIFFLDDDDLLPKYALEILYNEAEKCKNDKKIGGVTGALQFFVEKNEIKKFTKILKPWAERIKYVVGGGKGIIKKDVFKKIGVYDINLKASEDTELAFRFCKHFELKTIPTIVYYARRHKKASLHNQPGSVDDYIKVIQKYKKIVRQYPNNLYSIMMRTISLNLFSEGRMREGRSYLLKAILSTPFNLKHYLILLASFVGVNFIKFLINLNSKIKN